MPSSRHGYEVEAKNVEGRRIVAASHRRDKEDGANALLTSPVSECISGIAGQPTVYPEVPMTEQSAVIVSVRLWLPSEKREFEMRISRDLRVDAVFAGRHVVEQILIPYYEQIDAKKAEDLGEKIVGQEKECDFVCVPHQASCKKQVPDIRRGEPFIELSNRGWE
jgi:hypothetical protein